MIVILPYPASTPLGSHCPCGHCHGLQDGQRISVGDCVELQPAPGEVLPMVAQLQELWSERPGDGQERMLARICRFYRPQVRLMPCAKYP